VPTKSADLHDEAVQSLIDVLSAIGLRAHEPIGFRGHGAPDLVIHRPDGSVTAIEVKAASTADLPRVAKLLHGVERPTRGESALRFLVADEITESARHLLRDSGWAYLDRRGRLFLRDGSLLINDTEIEPVPRGDADHFPTQPITGSVGVGVALVLLMNPGEPIGVRELARALKCAPSSAHAAMQRLRTAALVDTQGRFERDLFWALADVWRPIREAVASEPMPGQLRIDFGQSGEPGWAVGGDVAAAAWGAPVSVGSDSPPDLYAPDRREMRLAVRAVGTSTWAERRATIAVAPTPVAIAHREMRGTGRLPWLHWPFVHPVVAALDLAQDRSRGQEILQDWRPTNGVTRVW